MSTGKTGYKVLLRVFLAFVFLVTASEWSIGQTITGGEYFWDNDPGPGNGAALLATDGNFDEAVESAIANPAVSLGAGVHTLGVRFRDDSSAWGEVYRTVISMTTLAGSPDSLAIDQGEYFWDVDPGLGNGTAMLAFDGNFDEAVETAVANPITGLTPGAHVLGVRFRDHGGVWGEVFRTVVSITTLSGPPDSLAIDQGEYFWDVDPGLGNGTAMLAFDGNFDEAVETAVTNPVTGLTAGAHVLGVRFRNQNGSWGEVFRTVVSVTTLAGPPDSLAIDQGEYFWDADPGFGNGTAMLAFDGNFDEAVETAVANPITGLTAGPHVLGVRFRNDNGTWGEVYRTVVSITTLAGPQDSLAIDQGEYFWDADPGFGNGTTLLAFDGNFDEAVETAVANPITGLAAGPHVLGVRFRDDRGIWGEVYRTVVSVTELAGPVGNPLVVEAEAYWDADPGPGNGIALNALDGNFDEAIEEALNSLTSGNLSLGYHRLGVRMKGTNGVWGPSYYTVVGFDSSIVPLVQNMMADTSFCENDNLTGINYSVFPQSGASYNWTISGGTIVSGNGTASVFVDWSGAGNHSLSVQGCNSNGCGNTFVQTVSVAPAPVADFSFVANLYTVTFSNSSQNASSYLWSFGDGTTSSGPNPSHVYSQPGVYVVCLESSGPCGTSIHCDTVSLASIVPVVQNMAADTAFCEGDNLQGIGYSIVPDSGATYNWSVSGGTISSGNGTSAITVDWSGPGNHTVSVQGCNTNGCGNTFVQTVIVTPNPTAAFTFVANLTSVTFSNTSLNSNSYAWDFGDGTTSPSGGTHVYSQPGTYVVCLQATGTCGADTLCDTVTVVGAVPMVQSMSGDSSLCENGNLSGQTYSVAVQTGTTFNWSITGGVITSGNGTATVTVDWGVTGPHILSVQGCNSNGCGNTFVRNVTVSPAPVAGFSFATSQNSVTFTNTSLNSSSYFWDFGDGTNSPSGGTHVYSQAGTYVVCLQATGTCGTDTVCDTVTVAGAVPLVQSMNGDSSFCENDNLLGLTYSVPNQSGTTFNWTISGGTIVSGNGTSTVTVDWSGAGLHILTVQGCNANGCGNTFVRNVIVTPAPVAGFAFSINQNTVLFSNTSLNSNSYFWDFGDGNFSLSPTPTHTYSQTGNYQVCLEASGTCGMDIICGTISVVVVGVEDPGQSSLVLYPNPNRGRFKVKLPAGFSGERLEMEVWNVVGQRIWQARAEAGSDDTVELVIPEVTRGSYLLRIHTKGRTFQERFEVLD